MPHPWRTEADLDKYRKLEAMLPVTKPRPPMNDEDKKWTELLSTLGSITEGLNRLLESQDYIQKNGIWRKP